MAKATRKTQSPPAGSTATEPSTSGAGSKKQVKSPRKPKSRGSVKVTNKTVRAKRQPRGSNVTNKDSLKTSPSSKKMKKGKGVALFGHYRRMKKAQEPHESQWDQPSTSKAHPMCDN